MKVSGDDMHSQLNLHVHVVTGHLKTVAHFFVNCTQFTKETPVICVDLVNTVRLVSNMLQKMNQSQIITATNCSQHFLQFCKINTISWSETKLLLFHRIPSVRYNITQHFLMVLMRSINYVNLFEFQSAVEHTTRIFIMLLMCVCSSLQ